MFRLITVVTIIAILWVSQAAAVVVQGAADESSADPLAYTPTGDELWDTYAQAMLLEFGKDTAFRGSASMPISWLSQDTLDSWEAQYGDDPRYWQLLFWEAHWQSLDDDGQRIDPVYYLAQGAARGVTDAITEMLMYQNRLAVLNRNWDMYADGTLPPDSDFAPVITGGAAEYSWYVKERLALGDELVATCPDESWAWYEGALTRFAFGTWEDGLADMSMGNLAANNRMPLPFPMSFVNQRVLAGEDCGSEIIVGLVLQGHLNRGMPNYIRLKDQLKNQEVRLHLGSPLGEYAPWHGYTCRLGTMEGAEPIQWLVAIVMRSMMLHHLFVETPEVFTIDQRNALWELHGRSYSIRELSKDANSGNLEDVMEAMDLIAARYGIDLSQLMENDESLWESDTYQAMMLEMAVAGYHWHYVDYQESQTEYYPRIKERFEKLAEFDMTTYSWPDL